jgi:putative transcriptional regulator
MRVVNPTPNAVVLHGLDPDALWEYAPKMARLDGFSLAITDEPLDDVLEALRDFP